MSMEHIKNTLGTDAKDIRLNLSMILSEEGCPQLSLRQIFTISLACAYATKNNLLITAIISEGENTLSEKERQAAKSAAIIMSMNNVYYRFVHLSSDKNFASMPAKLRMNVLLNPGIHKSDFELACLAVSAINGCGMCIDAHIHELQKASISNETIQSAIRIAAVLNATATAMEIP